MTTERKSREQDSRDNDPIHEPYDPSWEPQALTSAPPARAGMEQRWVRTRILGVEDSQNIAKRMHQGWHPRAADTVPQGWFCKRIRHGDYGDVIVSPDGILMERAIWKGDKVRARQADINRAKVQGIAQFVQGRMPTAYGVRGGEADISIRTEQGRQPKIADD